MEFLVRFFLGLPPREKDIQEIQNVIPELQELNKERIIRRFRYLHLFLIDYGDELIDELKKWVNSFEPERQVNISTEDCPKLDCPMKSNGSHKISSDDDVGYLQYLIAGGGPKSKPPKDMFYDLVRKSKKKFSVIKDVILTDPYLYLDVSEDGINGGFNNLVGYLEAVGISQKSSFTLKVNPSPKKATKKAKQSLHKMLQNEYPNISIGTYSPQCNFHDRFYIVRDDKGLLGGVFGPSLNGLNSTAIVLMGDIEGLQPIKKLSQWL